MHPRNVKTTYADCCVSTRWIGLLVRLRRGCKVLSQKGDLMKAMKLFSMFAVMLMLFAVTPPFAAPVGVATMNGVYSFQVIGVSPQWGYLQR
jgi:hypothetical protein